MGKGNDKGNGKSKNSNGNSRSRFASGMTNNGDGWLRNGKVVENGMGG